MAYFLNNVTVEDNIKVEEERASSLATITRPAHEAAGGAQPFERYFFHSPELAEFWAPNVRKQPT